MNSIFIWAVSLLMSTTPTFSSQTQTSAKTVITEDLPAERVVVSAFDAYNERNLDKFLKLFAEDAEVTMFPNKSLLKGKEAIAKNYNDLFTNTPDLEATLLTRQVKDNRVIDEMLVTRVRGKKGDKVSLLYEVENGLIVRMCFL